MVLASSARRARRRRFIERYGHLVTISEDGSQLPLMWGANAPGVYYKAFTALAQAHEKANTGNPNPVPAPDFQSFVNQVHGKAQDVNSDPRAGAIKADLLSGKIKREDAVKQLAALGYK